MSTGELVARHYATGEPVRVTWREGLITSIERATNTEAKDWIAPALVDLQVNGFAGIDFQQDDLTGEQLLTATRGLRAAGCGRYLLTLITDDWRKLLKRLRHVRSLRGASPEIEQAIVGWHIEGPFLSADPGFCGAHDPHCMLDPSPADIEALREAAGEDLMLLTIAPERSGAIEAIRIATALDMLVSLGHTDATADILQRAVEAGAVAFTHLGNGCPRALDRHDNILWRVFEERGLHVSLIPDAIHVSPPLFRLAHRVLGERIFYVSDAMSAAGSPPGRYKLGRLELEVGEDRIVRFPGSTNFAGSALAPLDGIFRAATMLGADWQSVWQRFSDTPAKLLGLPGGFAVGCSADFCVPHESVAPGAPHVSVFMSGKRIGS